MRFPMSPPLSQRSRIGDEHPKDTCQQQHQRPTKSLHPFDDISSIAPPKKTLNWVNALPSHFDTSLSGSLGSGGSNNEGDALVNGNGGHPRKRRRRTNREELEILEEAFSKNLLPDAATRQELGERLGMSVRAVQIWFQNRRQQLRKKSISSSSGGINGLGSYQAGSEEDLPRSTDEKARVHASLSPTSSHRRSSEDSSISTSPTLFPHEDLDRVPKIMSGSCSDLTCSSAFLPKSKTLKQESVSFPSAETGSSLPSASIFMSSCLDGPTKRSSSLQVVKGSNLKHERQEEMTIDIPEAIVKLEEMEPSISREHSMSGSKAAAQDMVDIKTADLHLSMLLEEAKKRSQQGTLPKAPVMAIWPGPSTKPVLNSSLSGPLPAVSTATTSFPLSTIAYRTKSMPSIRSLAAANKSHHHLHRPHFQVPSALQDHRPLSPPRAPRKHRSMPESVSSSASLSQTCSRYPRTISLMEQVINRQQQQQHYRHHSPPSSFKQSALSSSKGRHHYLDRSISNKATRSSPIISAGLSAAQLARRLQHVVSTNVKDIWPQCAVQEQASSLGARVGGARRVEYGQTAMRARRLSIGKYLFDSDTEEEVMIRKPNSASGQQRSMQHQQPQQQWQQQQQSLTHQAQKRGATLDQSVDGDETDEEDFIAQNERAKLLNGAKRFVSSLDQRYERRSYQNQHQHQQDWSGTYKMPRKALKSTHSTFSLAGATSSPTREYGLELNERPCSRSHIPHDASPFTVNHPHSVLDRSRTRSSGSGQQQQQQHHPASNGGASLTSLASALPSTNCTKDLNLDELECASVLAGLGWGR
ncbi:hypothetical protein BGX28_000370 [Mortierella sp. GBA30]|nr:hypothetical protein BGX28_000370 [Mortierella sp. GBA30]